MKPDANVEVVLLILEVGFDDAKEGSSSSFHTTIRIGKSDIHDDTKRAVDTAFGVGFLGGLRDGAVELVFAFTFVFGLPSLLCVSSLCVSSSPPAPPRPHTPANERIVRCCESVVSVQRTR